MSDDPHTTEAAKQAPPVAGGRGSGGGLPQWLPARLREALSLPNDHPRKTVAVALVLCLVCSVLVAGAAVVLRPVQDANRALDRKQNILAVAGLLGPGVDVDEAFSRFEARAVDLETGTFTDAVDPASYDQRAAAADPQRSRNLPRAEDPAGIGRRANVAVVYLLREGDRIQQVILPVHGYGLWSTLYGFLSLEGDLATVAGLRFYEHAETPGLGGEVDNPAWRGKWQGKVVFGEGGEVRLQVVKGNVDPGAADAKHQVDGLAGATLTSRGVTNLIRYWLGDRGFGPFLDNLRSGKA